MLGLHVLKCSLKLRRGAGTLFLSARRTGAGFPKFKRGFLILMLKTSERGFDLT